MSNNNTPETSVTFTINCVAPGSGGAYREDWRLVGPGGTIAVSGSSSIWVQIQVSSAAGSDGASFVSETVPDGTQMTAGQTYSKSWTLRNSGTTTWNSNYSLQ